jgi:adenylate cyclase
VAARLRHLRARLFVATGVVAAVIALALELTGLLTAPELQTVDARYEIRGSRPAPRDVVVVAIDDRTLGGLRFQPELALLGFPRSLHGRVVERLHEAGARTIAYDVQFTEPTVPEQDNRLIEAVADAGGAVLATTLVDERGRSNVFGGENVLRSIRARAASAVVPTDRGGVVRRFSPGIAGLETFATVAAERYTGRRIGPDEFPEARAWIDFAGPPGTFRTYSFIDVMRGNVSSETFRDRLVVVGPSAGGLQDLHPTPLSGERLMSGAELQANAISTVLRGFPLRSAPFGLTLLSVFILAMAAPLMSLRMKALRALGLAGLAAAAFAVATQVAFQEGIVMHVVAPLMAFALAAAGTLAVQYLTETRERRRMRSVFARFVPEAVVEDVLERTEDDLRLGGTRRLGTVMFADLRSFTSFSETLEPDAVIRLLNRYLEGMSEAILGHGGTLVAYMGDGVMAVFGAPIEQSDHADRALAAAREMLSVRLPEFNRYLREEGLTDEGFRLGIGLNSGYVMSGNVGSSRRLEYTAVGDTTNTAARIERMTKGTPYQLMMSGATRELLTREDEELIYVRESAVEGRDASIDLWSVAEAFDGAVGPPVSAVARPATTPAG